ncbi:MAG TPA: carbon-nitrogen hydrolase family protein [Kofleriaceae bacterium]|nr:carbon-nitrogen hydrolase family protein [Kofleriaceae bacterium]
MTRAALVAVQLEIGADVLVTPEAYRLHIEAEGERALAEGGGEKADARLVVYPEIAGHLALYALAPHVARRAKTLGGALAAAAARRPLDVIRGVATTRLLDARHAVLAALAPDGERWWKSVFGPLARRLDAYIVAGSYLRLGSDGALTNASLLFAPDGRLLATTDKVNLVPGMEDGARGALALARGDARIPIVETPLGRVATLVCYDGFREPHTSTERFVELGPLLAERGGVDIVANPAANPWPWKGPWKFNEPGESLVREEQWRLEGLTGSLTKSAFAKYGITAHLVGKVLDLAFDGASEIVACEGGVTRVLARAEHHDRGGHVTALVTC